MYNCELEPVRREFWIPRSHAGIDATVRHMDRIATDAASSPAVTEAAADITGSSSGHEAAERIRDYLATRMAFEFDPSGVELIRTPELLLHQIGCNGVAFGDCDDVAVLGAALGMAAGLRASYVLLAFHDTEPFEHVYAELDTDSGAVELDTTRPAALPPELEIRRTERREVAMYHSGLSGFGLVVAAPQIVPEPPAEEQDWWEGLIDVVGDWADTALNPSTDPYGPGYHGGTYVSEPQSEIVVAEAAPPTNPLVNALLFGAIGLAGLKLAKII